MGLSRVGFLVSALFLAGVTIWAVLAPSGPAAGSVSAAKPIATNTAIASASPTPSPGPNEGSARGADAVNSLQAATGQEPVTAACRSNGSAQLILVSITQQRAWMCDGHRQAESSAVTTGDVAAGNQTPLGTWQIQAKQADRDLTGPGYSEFVRFWMPFNGDFGFHDASWQKFPFGSQEYLTHGSEGCVHIPTVMMSWLYSWAKVGTTVTITT
jgi:lipoprotein-anchoring transpeptidase ErfK/SrfK